MDGSPSTILKFLFPRIPFILKTTVAHSLWLSPTSSSWDLKTELLVNVVRDMLLNGAPTSISKVQRATLKDPGIKGNVWASKVTMPAPQEDDLRQLLFEVIDELKEGGETYTPPPPQPLEAEWHGYRAELKKDGLETSSTEEEKFESLMKEVTSPSTLLYFHGGAYYMMDPTWYRAFLSKVARHSGGRVFNVRYRLAPQNPFPAALLDALVSYLSLLYPPPGASHKPVRPQDIVFGGDSAGGNLATVLLVFILHLHQRSSSGSPPTVVFNGQTVEIPIPAGAALSSPWLDMTRSMPSLLTNLKYDYLPPPTSDRLHSEKTPTCSIWPADPPRETLYCNGDAMRHPLTSPVRFKNWKGCPPIFVVCGEEMLADEDMVMAQTIARQGGKVVWEQYEKMPHVFANLVEDIPASKKSFETYGKFCKTVVEKPEEIKTEGYSFAPKKLTAKAVDVTNLIDLTDEKVEQLMKDAQKGVIESFQEWQSKKSSKL